MQLTPRYGPDPVIVMDGSPGEVAGPAVGQLERLLGVLEAFTEDQWAHPSRCQGWTNQDVIVHLETATSFWVLSVGAGLRGEPTRFLATFDPVATPAQMVAGSAGATSAEVLDRFRSSVRAYADLLRSLDGDGWATQVEAPPGHVGVDALAHHGLWDAWVHERDILLPLGIEPPVEVDEVAAGLRYVAALGPAFAITRGVRAEGVLAVEGTGPDVTVLVEVGEGRATVRSEPRPADSDPPDLCLRGGSVDLLEALSVRVPLAQPIPPERAWMLSGLRETFDSLPL